VAALGTRGFASVGTVRLRVCLFLVLVGFTHKY
jgi:hypothetical protein